MKQKRMVAAFWVGLWAFLLISIGAVALRAQQTQSDQNDYEALEKFLPGDDDAKVLLMIQCTLCHSAAHTQQRIALRAGGDITFWTTLVRRMNTTWNAKIPEEDIDVIVAYLAKYFGPSSKPSGGAGESRGTRAEKKPGG